MAQWTTHGTVTPFALGTQDLSGHFRIPQQLVGREGEIQQLLAAFDAMTTSGRDALLLVSGPAGIGKSVLVHELHQPVTERSGYFISGKFDQYQRDIPYATLTQALRELVLQILTESEERIAAWRQKIAAAVDANGQLIIEVLPQIELIIGAQAPVPELPPAEAQNRFLMMFERFICVFAQQAHPLVLFLDDLQWADAASLKLLRELVTSPDNCFLLVVGAYRDNEVNEAGPTHPLTLMLDSLRSEGTTMTQITLGPLSQDTLCTFTDEMLQCERGVTAPLAHLIYQKTAGNPFFMNEFIKALADEGLIAFDTETKTWRWDLERISAKGYTDNVVVLMIDKLARLPEFALTVVQRLACLSSGVQESMLALVCDQPPAELHAALSTAVDAGLVMLRTDGTVSFLHDRLQEAAYQSIPVFARAALHLHIGRRLLADKTQAQIEELLFPIVSQFNRGVDGITAAGEKALLCQLNFLAGNKAKATIAYASARSFLDQAFVLLPADAWQAQHQLCFAITLALSECEYLVGNFERADQLTQLILANASGRGERAQAYRLRMQVYQMVGRYTDAVSTMFEVMRLFDMNFPSTEPQTEAAIDAEVHEISDCLQGRSIADIADAPQLADADMEMVIALLVEAIPAAYVTATRPDYFSLITARAVKLSLLHGHTEDSCLAYSNYGAVLLSRCGDISSACEFSAVALQLSQNLGSYRFKGRPLMLHAITFSPWKDYIASATALLDQAFASSLEVGDLLAANYIALCHFWPMLQQGVPLDTVAQTTRRHPAFALDSHNEPVCHAIRFQQQLVANLKGQTRGLTTLDDDDFDEALCLVTLEKAHFVAGLYIAYVIKQVVAFIQGDYAGALAAAQQAAPKSNSTGNIIVIDCTHHFYFALTLAALYPQASDEEQREFAGLLAAELDRHKLWSEHCQQNFLNCYALVGAEIARIEGRTSDAERLYEEAIGAARDNGFIQNEAIAFELASRFYRARGFELIADTYLRQARTGYLRWGADGKVAQLDASYPQVREGSVAVPLDALSVTKASQAISSRVVLNELADTLLHIVLENAGAQTGVLLLSGNQGLELAAQANADQAAVHVRFYARQAPAEGSLPVAILNYVRRSRELVLLPDVAHLNPYSADVYFASHHPRSVLCLPILRQDKLIGLLYLENELVTHAFAPQRVEVLKLLASQAAISLENARLYADLQQENEARKQAEQAAQQLAAIVTSSEDAIIGKTLEGTIISWNGGAERMYGYSEREMLGRSISTLLPPDVPDETATILARLRKGEPVEPHETVRVRKDGRRINVSLTISPIRDLNGRVIGASTIARDISERKRAEQALWDKEARIRRLVDSNIIGVIFWDLSGGITDANDAFLQLCGYAREDLLAGKIRWSDMTPPEYHAADEQAQEELLKTGSCTPLEKEYIRKDGSRVPVLISSAMFEESRDQGLSFVLDLSARKRVEEQVRHMADHDALTSLPNRALLQDRMHQAIAYAHRNERRVAILFIDLDYFKNINDSLGHHIGDVVLKMTAARLQKCLREGDSVARLGGDEFVLILPLLHDSNDAARVAQKALDALAQPFIVEAHDLHLSGSIGISLYPDDGFDVDALMRTADTAMYHAKDIGRGNYQFFTAALNQAAQQRLEVGTRLRQALVQDEFVMHYQPQVQMQSGQTFSIEALLRWQPPGAEPISCSDFIANAEESGLITSIGEWALRQACRQLRIWHDAGHSALKMAVNLSPRQLEQTNFCSLVGQILDETGISPDALELEITEGTMLQRNEATLAALTQLSHMGIQLSVDDFGTGYSSLSYLQRFPVHALKIDQSFVHDISTNPNDTTLVTAIIAMANSLHLKVVAEGVETLQQAQFLMAHGCLVGQGFFYSRAVPAQTLSQWLRIKLLLPGSDLMGAH